MACLTPFLAKQKMSTEKTPVPCGKCPECMKRRASAWSFRLMQEERISSSAHFITLTYDTKYVPITRNGFMSLDKRDLQLFFKRLRKRNSNQLKYYAVGEYGGRTFRPHYHIILFNVELPTISPSWELGHVHYGQVEAASVGYTLKYISKPKRIPQHRNDDRLPEFGTMSKRLGASYLSEKMKEWHLADMDNRMYCNLLDGKKIAMPRYYKDRIYDEQQRKRVAFFARLDAIKRMEKLISNPDYYAKKAEADLNAFNKAARKAADLSNNKI